MFSHDAQLKRLNQVIKQAGKRYDTSVNLRVENMFNYLYALNREQEYLTDLLGIVYKVRHEIGMDVVTRKHA